MTITYVKRAVDKAFTMKEGETIVIPCNSFRQMELIRVQCYKERKRLVKAYGKLAESIDVRREILKLEDGSESYAVHLTKGVQVEAFVLTKDGKVEELRTEPVASELEPVDTERMKQLMKEDGFSDEEIANLVEGG